MTPITICCAEMLKALGCGLHYHNNHDPSGQRYVGVYLGSPIASPVAKLKFCPWCGKELPFPYEEDE